MREPSTEEVILAAVKAGLAQVHTQLPGIVKSYDAATKTASVEPAVFTENPRAPIPGVPVKFPSGGGYRLVWPLQAGDEVTLHFYELDPTRFRVTGEAGKAQVKRRHGQFCFATPGDESVPGLADINAGDDARFGRSDGSVDIVVTPSQVLLGSAAASAGVANGAVLDTFLTTLQTWLAAHVHSSSGAGPPAAAPPSPPTTESAKVLADFP